MTSTISFLTTADLPGKTLASVLNAPTTGQDENGAETAGEGAFDGFAALLDQLVQIAPAPVVPVASSADASATIRVATAEGEAAPEDAGLADRQSGNRTGKKLPVAGSDIAGLASIGLMPSLGLVANPAEIVIQASAARADARLPDTAASVTPSIPIGVDGALKTDPAVKSSAPFPGLTATVASPVAMPSLMSVAAIATSSGPSEPAAAVPNPDDAPARSPATPTTITAIRLGTPDADRIVTLDPANLPARDPATGAAKPAPVPVDEAVRRIASAQTATTAPLPTKPVDAAMPAVIATVAPIPTVAPAAPRKPGPTLVNVQPDGAPEGKAEAKVQTVIERPVEPVQASARLTLVADNAKPVEAGANSAPVSGTAPSASNSTPLVAPLAAIAASASATVTRAADLARPDAFAAIDSITRLVDRLSAVRDFGSAAAASFSVTHREFGELAIAIDRVSDALEVAITAKDGEAQRALAAAMATERAAPRAFEALQQAANHTSLANAERGAANAQSNAQANPNSSANSSAGGFNANSNGNADSQSDAQRQQRARAQDAATRGQHPSARPQADDAGLYA